MANVSIHYTGSHSQALMLCEQEYYTTIVLLGFISWHIVVQKAVEAFKCPSKQAVLASKLNEKLEDTVVTACSDNTW